MEKQALSRALTPTKDGGARARAGAAPTSDYLGWDCQKGRIAHDAFASYGACSLATPEHGQFVVAQQILGACLRPVGVADHARRHKVVRPVVRSIPVQVVRDEAAWHEPGRPVHGRSAPVAPMRPRADLLVQHEACCSDHTRGRCDRVTARGLHALGGGRRYASAPAKGRPIALLRAEARLPGGRLPRLHRTTARLAGAHLSSVDHKESV